ncbi:hypothetical protein EVJ58_g6063 [Rhodofomes roseus]|uniref:Uncharacterized protein n=1 Tax=Rhodofomes roseus TaxID=34475 RepID=A0A4Y9Y9U7_9APHY|nr:hypothetical protein EVJ58_g6063 [Rhodofomes roseus]
MFGAPPMFYGPAQSAQQQQDQRVAAWHDGLRRKIGEALYSEVFGIGDVVLRVIPLRDEEQTSSRDDDGLESPAPSDAKDVLKEIIVTRAMGEICPGFVKLLRMYVVRGTYPLLLLVLWDNYNERKGNTFGMSQFGWKQACSLFWQVAQTLAETEGLVCFEHRDRVVRERQCYWLRAGGQQHQQSMQGMAVPMDQGHGQYGYQQYVPETDDPFNQADEIVRAVGPDRGRDPPAALPVRRVPPSGLASRARTRAVVVHLDRQHADKQHQQLLVLARFVGCRPEPRRAQCDADAEHDAQAEECDEAGEPEDA